MRQDLKVSSKLRDMIRQGVEAIPLKTFDLSALDALDTQNGQKINSNSNLLLDLSIPLAVRVSILLELIDKSMG
jgi:hypothetical protein